MLLTTTRRHAPARRREAFTLIEVLVVVAILVILATIAAVAVPKQLMEARKGTAVTGCVTVSKACEAYFVSASNPGVTDDEKMPTSLQDLMSPQWNTGGVVSSFLPDPNAANDPWGKPYQLHMDHNQDGTPFIIVYTIAPDGTKISQFGAGAKSRM